MTRGFSTSVRCCGPSGSRPRRCGIDPTPSKAASRGDDLYVLRSVDRQLARFRVEPLKWGYNIQYMQGDKP
jgi:hypothetical protein